MKNMMKRFKMIKMMTMMMSLIRMMKTMMRVISEGELIIHTTTGEA